MTRPRSYTVYTLTEQIHANFLGENSILSNEEIGDSGVKLAYGLNTPNVTQRLMVEGELDGRAAYQSLAKDRHGTFHLSTVFNGAEHVQHDIRPTTPLEQIDVITDSLFMSALVRIATDRR